MNVRYLVASLVLATATASSAAVLVVRSSGPSARNFPPGKSLDDNGKIALKANDMIVVLDARGTRTLKGPGTFTPGGPAQASGAMSSLRAATGAGRGRARVGAVRSVGTATTPKPTIWQVDVSKSADICLSRSATLTLWRPDSAKPMVMTVTGGNPATTRKLEWRSGQSSLLWPADMPIADGKDYRLSWDGGGAPTRIRFKTLASQPVALEETAAVLIRNGCTAQLDHLIATVPQG